jgi:hypothetical protein
MEGLACICEAQSTQRWRADELPGMTRAARSAAPHHLRLPHLLQFSSPSAQFFQILSLVLSAAAACPVFGPRSSRAHHLQPPAQLCFTLSQRSLELAYSCRDSRQRVQLLCCSCPLSILAFRLARAVNRHEGSRSSELRATACIMRRCFGGFAWRFWSEHAQQQQCVLPHYQQHEVVPLIPSDGASSITSSSTSSGQHKRCCSVM